MPVPRQCHREDESAGAEHANGAHQRLGDERAATACQPRQTFWYLTAPRAILMLLTAPLAESSFSYQAAPRALMLLKAPLVESELCLDHEVGHGRRRASCTCRNHPPVVRGAGAAARCGNPCLVILTRPKPSTRAERNERGLGVCLHSLSRGCGGRTCSGNWSKLLLFCCCLLISTSRPGF